MATSEARILEIGLTAKQIIDAVKRMKKEDRLEFVEDLLASTNPEYLESIREARADHRVGDVKTLDEIFGE